MFTLMTGFYKYMFKKDEYFVLILGLDNAGKTTFLEQTKTKFNRNYKGINLKKITSTVGLNIGKIDTSNIRLSFWDLGGQEELQSLWDKYYAESNAIIYVVDSSDENRLDESKSAFDQMISNASLQGVPLLVLANKQDLPNCVSMNIIDKLFCQEQSDMIQRSCKTQSASALTGEGIDEGIKWLVNCIKNNSFFRPPLQT
ncbi:hypothetical protein HELRODRAFT_156111 [Helobdella robusta]|uniref:ADP-ribosylation factor-related protein 1 n=1 Tax=Helobdella robusta TaxID=6412 RepID=T1ELR7_HELRO|nr:hypothetical protein HELRODRAFT_156111 [Helobdella robusta]ESN93080.1 hypothetical protein HELRODRAFT_156111 [Helobdella robusta]